MSVMENQDNRCALSLEVVPPKTDVGMEQLRSALGQLYALHPSWITCSADPGRNLAVLDQIVRDGSTAPMTCVACRGNSREDLRQQLQTYLNHDIRHVLALRGSPSAGRGGGELQSAAQLVELIRREFGDRFTVGVSGAPEGRRSLQEDIEHLKRKRDNGADYIMTRLCWDVDGFRRWLDGIRAAGIFLPVVAGVMPVLDQAATIHMTMSSSGGVIPAALSEIISRNWIYPNPFVKDPFDADAEGKKISFKAAGMAFTLEQIDAYRGCGVDGIHLHTQNRFDDAVRIVREAGLISQHS